MKWIHAALPVAALMALAACNQTTTEDDAADADGVDTSTVVPGPTTTETAVVPGGTSTVAVPVPGATRIEREMRLVLRLRLEQSRLVTVRHGQGVTVCDYRKTGTMELLPPRMSRETRVTR